MSEGQRRIKLVLSDFHMGFGRANEDGTVNNLEDFTSDRQLIDFLEYYRTGEFYDAEVELILNGDTFEGLSCIDVNDPHRDMITVSKSLGTINRIIDGHIEVFEALHTFADSPNRSIVIMVGNHDQDLYWPDVQDLLKERIHPSIEIRTDVYRFDGIHIEHGNQYEIHNRFDPDRIFLTEGLPEPILNLPWGSDFFINALMPFRSRRPYANKVRPYRIAALWSLVHDFRGLMSSIWLLFSNTFKTWVRKPRVRRISFWHTVKVFFGRHPFPNLEAAAEHILALTNIHTVIFGHTHAALWRQLLPGKTYLNSGAWMPNINLHIDSPGIHLLLTYVYIEYEEGRSRPRPRLKVWHGRREVEEDIVL